ncbi:hypothetical protein ACSBR2_028413 [Camellia fascicularis]
MNLSVIEILPEPENNTLDNFYRTWTTIEGKTFNSLHPPIESVELVSNNTKSEPLSISAYVCPTTNEAKLGQYCKGSDLNAVIKQNNYSNLHFQTIGTQLSHIEEYVENILVKHTIP